MKAEVNEKLVPEWNVDDGTEEYWRDAAKEGQLISKEWHEIIPRIDMRKIACVAPDALVDCGDGQSLQIFRIS